MIAVWRKENVFLTYFVTPAAASIHAAALGGSAAENLSIDMSNTYLDQGRRIFELPMAWRKQTF